GGAGDGGPTGHGSRIVAVPPTSSTDIAPRMAMSAYRDSPRQARPAYTGSASSPKRASDVNEPVSSGSRTIARPETIQGQGTPLRRATTSSATYTTVSVTARTSHRLLPLEWTTSTKARPTPSAENRRPHSTWAWLNAIGSPTIRRW